MLRLSTRITVIKNKASTSTEHSPVLSNNFNISSEAITIVSTYLNESDFVAAYDAGKDLAIIINYATDIETESNFREQTKKGKITLPRNLPLSGLNIISNTSSPLFGRGDRVLIECGYDGNLKEIFRGYITKVNMGTPMILDIEDQMFVLKQMKAKIEVNKKLTLKQVLQYVLTEEFNPNVTELWKQDYFTFINTDLPTVYNTVTNNADPNGINTQFAKRSDGKTPVIVRANSNPFTYCTGREKSAAEILDDLRKKTGMFIYYDDFGNLRVELPFINSDQLTVKNVFVFEKQMISEDLNYQRADELSIKIIYRSKASKATAKPPILFGQSYDATGKGLGYIGDQLGDSITVNAPEDISQADCDANAAQLLKANKYSGYRPGSTFETFGEPLVYVGEAVFLISTKYPEKNGGFVVVGVKRKFGFGGYRQVIELGVQLPSDQDVAIAGKYINTYNINQ